jgi:hypothetical protein
VDAVPELDLAIRSGLVQHHAIANEDVPAKAHARVVDHSGRRDKADGAEACEIVPGAMRWSTPRGEPHRESSESAVACAEHPEPAPQTLEPVPDGKLTAFDDTAAKYR